VTIWTRSGQCAGTANCVEVGYVPPGSVLAGMILVRDSKMGDDSPVLEFTPEEMRAFIASVKAGEFDWTTDTNPNGASR
jgi:hypothetical protein